MTSDNVLSPSEVESYVEGTSTLNLNANTTIGGAAILTKSQPQLEQPSKMFPLD